MSRATSIALLLCCTVGCSLDFESLIGGDAGDADAGTLDAGMVDAGPEVDAGDADAGAQDDAAAPRDGGTDAGVELPCRAGLALSGGLPPRPRDITNGAGIGYDELLTPTSQSGDTGDDLWTSGRGPLGDFDCDGVDDTAQVLVDDETARTLVTWRGTDARLGSYVGLAIFPDGVYIASSAVRGPHSVDGDCTLAGMVWVCR